MVEFKSFFLPAAGMGRREKKNRRTGGKRSGGEKANGVGECRFIVVLAGAFILPNWDVGEISGEKVKVSCGLEPRRKEKYRNFFENFGHALCG